MQVMKIMDIIWRQSGKNFRLTPYTCMSMGKMFGMIEVVQKSKTIFDIQRLSGRVSALSLGSTVLHRWIKEHNKGEKYFLFIFSWNWKWNWLLMNSFLFIKIWSGNWKFHLFLRGILRCNVHFGNKRSPSRQHNDHRRRTCNYWKISNLLFIGNKKG